MSIDESVQNCKPNKQDKRASLTVDLINKKGVYCSLLNPDQNEKSFCDHCGDIETVSLGYTVNIYAYKCNRGVGNEE